MAGFDPIPPTYDRDRVGLHRLAAHVVAPAQRAVDGEIALKATPGGFGTPVFGDGRQVRVATDGHEVALVVRASGASGAERRQRLTSLAGAAAFAGVELGGDPGIGADPPPLGDVDEPIVADPVSAMVLAHWIALGDRALADLQAELRGRAARVSARRLWPEHFDIAIDATIDGVSANFGFSPGDGFSAAPYVYVGPWERAGLAGDFWNAPFGAVLGYDEVVAADHDDTAVSFLRQSIAQLAG